MSELDDIFSSVSKKVNPSPSKKRKNLQDTSSTKASLAQGDASSELRGAKKSKALKHAPSATSETGSSLHDVKTEKKLKKKQANRNTMEADDSNAGQAPTTAKKARAVPIVVHDETTTKVKKKPAIPRPQDDDDAAFVDSRGQDRTYTIGCTNAGKRTEEGFRVFTEDELKLNKGGGMCDFCSDDRYTIVPI